jgi:general secretion pathway protein C
MVTLALSQSALQNWLRPERSAQFARLANVLLIIWLAWMLAGLSWMLVPEPAPEQLPPSVDVLPAQAGQQAAVDERQIASWHIFGVAGEEQPVKKVVVVDAPDTRLKLVLKGVFASDEEANARAIVADPGGKEDHYSIGDPVPGGAKVSEIHADRIILERNGRFETLRLPKKLMSRGGQSVSHSSANRITRRPQAEAANKAAAFSQYREEIKQNPSAFLKYVRATPARENGEFIGFRLQAGQQRGALSQLGLEAGDIVTAINGVQIDSPAKGMKAMQALSEGDSINVTLLRSGQETQLNLTLPNANQQNSN